MKRYGMKCKSKYLVFEPLNMSMDMWLKCEAMSECSDYKKDADDSQVMVVYCILYLLEIKNHFVGGGDVGGTLLLDIM